VAKSLIEITTSPSEFKKMVMQAIADHINSIAIKIAADVTETIKPLVYDAVHDCHEMQALRSSDLRAAMGLNPPQARDVSKQIAESVSSSLIVESGKVTPKNLSTMISIYVQPAGLDNVLSVGGSTVNYTSTEGKQVTIPWLDWLLTEGDRILVSGFSLELGQGLGRSWGGRMVEAPTGSWRIEPQYAGTLTDNFVTRALAEKKLESAISKEIMKSVNKRTK
tara:strand:+ start:421 stop:1086 length:666 start_codon:yes stop_codon:yes gene_type:complete